MFEYKKLCSSGVKVNSDNLFGSGMKLSAVTAVH